MPKTPSRTATSKHAKTVARQAAAAIGYRVEIADLNAHLFRVTLTIARPAAQQVVALPVWIPGSYLVREFSKNVQRLRATQGKRAVLLTQLDKHRWQVDADPAQPLVITCEVYALDPSVRTAWLDARRGFFNGTSLLLAVQGQAHLPHELELPAASAPAGWRVATALTPVKIDRAGFGRYRAANYDELVDCAVELGAFWSGEFNARGVPHRFVVAGAAPSFDGQRLLSDTQKICEAEIDLWHQGKKPPHEQYLFLLNAVDDGYGGLEHRNSTALICKRADLPRTGGAIAAAADAASAKAVHGAMHQIANGVGDGALNGALQALRAATAASTSDSARQSDGYTTLLGLISHEYFHTWNVKRLKPAEFAAYDYSAENYTQLLWFFEGFTSYYDDLLLRRAGLIGDAAYLKLLTKTVNQVRQTPGRRVQSVAEASFDAWVKYYRPDENTPNLTVSYYTKGALVALCFDLTLRREGHTTLDDVMRTLWSRCNAGPMSEADFATVLEQIGGRSFAPEIAAWVHGTDDLPLKDLLAAHGVQVHEEPSQLAQRLGLRVTESKGVVVKAVLSGGAAERAGIAAGDEWIGIEPAPIPSRKSADESANAGWRIARLEDLALYAGDAKSLVALVARDRHLLRLPLALPHGEPTWRLSLKDAARARPWLSAND